MNQKILYESTLFDNLDLKESSPNAPETINPGTGQTDVSDYASKARLARNVISQSLPFMIGFLQPLTTPSGFVFGFKERQDTSITHPNFPYSNQGIPSDAPGTASAAITVSPPDPMTDNDQPGIDGVHEVASDTPPNPEDPVIIRRLVNTDVREVVFDLSNEAVQDVQFMFGEDFPKILSQFIENGGELYNFPERDVTKLTVENFFLPQMLSKATQKINYDFVEYADSIASVLGSVDISTITDYPKIFTAIGEMREALSKNTKKSGSIFILCTPKIANYIAGTLGMTASNGSDALEIGKPRQTSKKAGFVGQYGDVYVYQYTGPRTDTNESVIMGFDGENGPNTASIYYHPYKEYLIHGGENYTTGHSNIFFRVRDAWTVNPLDTFDKAITAPDENPNTANTSQFLVKANFVFGENAINP